MSAQASFDGFMGLPREVRFQIWQEADGPKPKVLELAGCLINHRVVGSCYIDHTFTRNLHCHFHSPVDLDLPAPQRCQCLQPLSPILDSPGRIGMPIGHRKQGPFHLCRSSNTPIYVTAHVHNESREETFRRGQITFKSSPNFIFSEDKIDFPFDGSKDTLAVNVMHMVQLLSYMKCYRECQLHSKIDVDNLKLVTKLVLIAPTAAMRGLAFLRSGNEGDFDTFDMLEIIDLFPNLTELRLTHCSDEQAVGPLVLRPNTLKDKQGSKGNRIFNLFKRQLNFVRGKLGIEPLEISFSCAKRQQGIDDSDTNLLHSCRDFQTTWNYPNPDQNDLKHQIWIPDVGDGIHLLRHQSRDLERKGMRARLELFLRDRRMMSNRCYSSNINGANCEEGLQRSLCESCLEIRREVKGWERLCDNMALGYVVDQGDDPEGLIGDEEELVGDALDADIDELIGLSH